MLAAQQLHQRIGHAPLLIAQFAHGVDDSALLIAQLPCGIEQFTMIWLVSARGDKDPDQGQDYYKAEYDDRQLDRDNDWRVVHSQPRRDED